MSVRADRISREDYLKRYRFENKFVAPVSQYDRALFVAKLAPLVFKEIYKERRVNSIYFDTFSRRFYEENVIGQSERRKFRIRWYGDAFSKDANAVLERKSRIGQMGTKDFFAIDNFGYRKGSEEQKPRFCFEAHDNVESEVSGRVHLKSLEPILLCSYQRRYFLSSCGDIRMTLDKDISYSEVRLDYSIGRRVEDKVIVIEVKYGHKHILKAQQVTNQIPFRLSKNSKYVNGFDLLEL